MIGLHDRILLHVGERKSINHALGAISAIVVKRLILAHGGNMSRAGRSVGLSPTYLCRVVHGAIPLSMGAYLKIAPLIGVKPAAKEASR